VTTSAWQARRPGRFWASIGQAAAAASMLSGEYRT